MKILEYILETITYKPESNFNYIFARYNKIDITAGLLVSTTQFLFP